MDPITARHIKVEAIRLKERDGRLNESDGVTRGADSVELRLAEDDAPFQEKLFRRTDYLAEILGIHEATDQLASRLRLVGVLFCLLCTGLGFLAAGNAFDSQDNSTVNFYWLILVLTGFNFLSMVLWCSALLLNFRFATPSRNVYRTRNSTLFSVVKWLMSHMVKSKNAGVEGNTWQGWIRVYGESGLATWSVSRMSHLCWLCYLGGGLVMVLLMLSVREYNFGWATTILKPETFVDLTQVLAVLPDALGLATPDREMIAASRLDSQLADQLTQSAQQIAASRHSWATLLLSSLVLYGMIPRIVLFLLCHWQTKRAVHHYSPDYNQPYFLDLRHRLIPVTRSLGVVDPDEDLHPQNSVDENRYENHQQPDNARFLSIEMATDRAWPPASISKTACLADANDSESQQQALAAVADLKQPLVCVVALMRSPDRGTARFLREVKAQCPVPVYLMIFGDFLPDGALANDSPAGQRLGDWHRLAAELDIPGAQLIHRQRHE